MASQPRTFLTPEQYLAIERAAEYKSEYFGGEMFAMSGAREVHVLITGSLHAELRGNCASAPAAHIFRTCACV